MEFPCSSKYKSDNETVEGGQGCLAPEAVNDTEFQDSPEEGHSSKVKAQADHPSDESRDTGVGDDVGPPEDLQPLHEDFPTDVDDEFEAATKDNP